MKRLHWRALSGRRSGIGLVMMFLGVIQMTAAGYAHEREFRGEFHQAAIFNSPASPDLTVEPCQSGAPVLQRPPTQAIQGAATAASEIIVAKLRRLERMNGRAVVDFGIRRQVYHFRFNS